jgi:hypothetical protein
MSPMFVGKRRVVITEPRENPRHPELNAAGRALGDSLRRAFARRAGFIVVDVDSVRAALAVSRVRSEIEQSLKPDLLIAPSFVGMGDTMTVIVTIRDVTNRSAPNTRTASSRIIVSSPGDAISGVTKGVVEQVDGLIRMPRQFRVVKPPPAPAAGNNDRR